MITLMITPKLEKYNVLYRHPMLTRINLVRVPRVWDLDHRIADGHSDGSRIFVYEQLQ